jgi:hypothetical protein
VGTYILYADASPDSPGGWVDDTVQWTLASAGTAFPWPEREGTIRFVCTGLCCQLDSDPTPRDPADLADLTVLTAGVHFDGQVIQAGCAAARQFAISTEETLVSGPVAPGQPDYAYPGPLPALAALAAGGLGCRGIVSSDTNGGVTTVGYAGFGGGAQIRGTYEPTSTVATTPLVNAGPPQTATGPAPSVVTTAATLTPGQDNGTITLAWTYESGPAGAAAPFIADPTALTTDITFAAFVAGSYVFQLTATTEGGTFTVTDTLTVTMATGAPRVSSGRTSVVWS